jgi:hypothetical protein
VKQLSDQSLYEILEVPLGAAREEIEKAYERAKSLYAPGSIVTYSLVDPEDAQYLAQRIEEARSVLLDPEARSTYDARLAAGSAPANVEPFPAPQPAVGPSRATPEPVRQAEPPRTSRSPLPAFPVIIPPLRTTAQPSLEPVPPPPQAAPERTPPPFAAVTQQPPSDPPAAAPAALLASAAVTPPVEVRPPPAPPQPDARPDFRFPEGTPWTGEMLRRVRESRGLTLQQIAEKTKVTRRHLESIEGDHYPMLPAPVYLRGIIMSLAKELRLDGQKVARSYLEMMTAATAPGQPPKVK